MAIACFVIGLLIIALSLGFAIRNRHNTKRWIACVTVGVFFSTFFMVLPTEWIKEGNTFSSPFLYRLASSLFYSFKALAGRAELAQIESMSLTGWVKSFYIAVSYISYIAAPILTSSLILSFFGDTAEKIKYWFSFSKKCCVFSELNENSLALANSMNKEKGRETIVFCNTKDADTRLVECARKIGGILLYKQFTALLPLRRKRKEYELYLIAEDKDKNVHDAEAVINKKESMLDVSVKVIVFTQDKISISILEDLAKPDENEKKSEKTGDKHFRMIFVDEIALLCNDLVFRHPLYDLPNGRIDISVMIVGCGTWGAQMLKTVLSNGQIDGYSLKISVFDNDINYRMGVFFSQCPEVKKLVDNNPNVKLSFVQADVMTNDFFDKIKENGSLDSTYVCIATSFDDVNLTVAENLYRYFRRENGYSYTPPIFVRVKNDELTENVSGNRKSYLQERGIELFGTATSFYAKKTLFNTKLERLALGAHLVYCTNEEEESRLDRYIRYLNSKKGKKKICIDKECLKTVDSFYASEYDRRSSMAAVLHFGAKIMSACGVVTKNGEITEGMLNKYEKAISNEDKLENMMKNEHDRWNFFTAAEGWQSVEKETIEKYYTGSHKDYLSKSHPCITQFDKLNALSKSYNDLNPKKEKNFKKEDEKIILSLPKIVRFADGIYEEEN